MRTFRSLCKVVVVGYLAAITPGFALADTIVVVGTTEEILYRRDSPEESAGTISTDSACGTVRVRLGVREVLFGHFEGDTIVAEQQLSTYCTQWFTLNPAHFLAAIALGYNNEILVSAPLFETRDGTLAGLPNLALDLGIPEQIVDVNFARGQGPMTWVSRNSEEFEQHPMWFREDGDRIVRYSKGVLLENLRVAAQQWVLAEEETE